MRRIPIVLIGSAHEVVKRMPAHRTFDTVKHNGRVFVRAFVSAGGETVYIEDGKVMHSMPNEFMWRKKR